MGWGEMMLIGVVALIVVGPKDLPVMFHSLGRMSAKARKMAREFSSAMSDAAESSGASDLTQEMRNLSSNNLGMGNSMTKAADAFDKWDPSEDRKAADKPKKELGPETSKLSKERAEAAEKIRTHSAKVAQARLDREAAEAAEAVASEAKAKKPAKKPAKKQTAKKPAKAKAKKTAKDADT